MFKKLEKKEKKEEPHFISLESCKSDYNENCEFGLLIEVTVDKNDIKVKCRPCFRIENDLDLRYGIKFNNEELKEDSNIFTLKSRVLDKIYKVKDADLSSHMKTYLQTLNKRQKETVIQLCSE